MTKRGEARIIDDVFLPIRRNDEHIAVHGQVFAIPAAYVQPDGAGLEVL